MTLRRMMLPLSVVAGLAVLTAQVMAQAVADPTDPGRPSVITYSATAPLDLTYTRPTQTTRLRNYLFDAFGPYPMVGAGLTAGINQANNTPPEWRQGAEGYGRRIGSNFGIAAITTTTRYTLAEAFHEDTLYYRCECKGTLPRLKHALISTLIARRGADGHRVFSLPALVAPYVGTMTAVYAWYPDRYNAKDAFRMGNYNMLAYAGGNVALEFLYSGPHSLLRRWHLNNSHGAPPPDSTPPGSKP